MSKVVIKKQDNSNFADKIALRLQECVRISSTSLRVLDCFHGSGKIWSAVSALYPGQIELVGIEKERGKSQFTVLEGDNMKFLPVIDLSNFDLIDLDAYGSVSKQLFSVLKNPTFNGCPVFITEITTFFGTIPSSATKLNGVHHLYKKNKTVFNSLYFPFVFEMFRKLGAKKIKYIRRDKARSRKLYGILYF